MATDWQVVSQRQSSVRAPSGQFEDAMIVTYKLTDGTVGQVTVPLSQYSAQTVHDLITAQADVVGSVSALSSSNPPPSSDSAAS
jgi:hypothetical protein